MMEAVIECVNVSVFIVIWNYYWINIISAATCWLSSLWLHQDYFSLNKLQANQGERICLI